MRFLILSAGLGLLLGCAGNQPNFLAMSEEELYLYNSDKPLRQQVYCFTRRETRSWIPRRRCATIDAILTANERAAGMLYTMSPSTGYSAFGPQRD